jgi:hypothetical protein
MNAKINDRPHSLRIEVIADENAGLIAPESMGRFLPTPKLRIIDHIIM